MRPLPAHLAGCNIHSLPFTVHSWPTRPPAQLQPALHQLQSWGERPKNACEHSTVSQNHPVRSSLWPGWWKDSSQRWNSVLHPQSPSQSNGSLTTAEEGLPWGSWLLHNLQELGKLLSFGLWSLRLTGIKHIAFKSQALKAKIHPKNVLSPKSFRGCLQTIPELPEGAGPSPPTPPCVWEPAAQGPGAAQRGAGHIPGAPDPPSLLPGNCAQPSNTSQKQKIREVQKSPTKAFPPPLQGQGNKPALQHEAQRTDTEKKRVPS